MAILDVKMITKAHEEFINRDNGILVGTGLVIVGNPGVQGDGYTIRSDLFIIRPQYPLPQSYYELISTLNKELNMISYSSYVGGTLIKEGIHSIIEIDRITNEYRDLGKDCAREAVKKLNEMIKQRN